MGAGPVSRPLPGIGAVTFVDHLGRDGVVVRWESRRLRKHLKEAPAAGSTWWAPKARGGGSPPQAHAGGI